MDIRTRVDFIQLAARLLRRNVGRRPDDQAVHGLESAQGVHRRVHGGAQLLLGRGFPAPAGHVLRQPPVHDEHLAEGADHDVLGLEIAMHHALGMRERHAVADLLKNGQKRGQRILFDRLLLAVAEAANDIVEGRALDELHRVKSLALIIDAELVERHDVRMLELAGELRLIDKTQHVLARELIARFHHLHGHRAADAQIARLQNHAHAAAIDRGDDLVFFAFQLLPHRRQAQVFVPKGGGELAGSGFEQPDGKARAADLDILIHANPRGKLHLHAIDKDAVAAAEILDDQFEGVESQPRMMPGDEFGIDENGAGGVPADDILAMFYRVPFEFVLADIHHDLGKDFIFRGDSHAVVQIGHFGSAIVHRARKSSRSRTDALAIRWEAKREKGRQTLAIPIQTAGERRKLRILRPAPSAA